MFIASGVSSAISFVAIWPLEVLKNLAQAETKGVGNTTRERANYVYRTQGIVGFWRGILPGAFGRLLGNGVGMIVMNEYQKKLTNWGMRD